jgi:voltage-gated potassium channel
MSWSALNLLNAKVSISTALSSGGTAITILLNKVGLLLFAYVNAIIIAWLLQQRKPDPLMGMNRDEPK